MGRKMKIFNFELESKLDLHFDVKFDGECDGDGPDSRILKTLSRPPKWPLLTPYGPKMEIFNFKLESKVDLHFDVTFDGECADGDGPGS